MKKNGILNVQLSKIIASMGHTDKLVICDCGFPIPRGAEVVDLALTKNIPHFGETLKMILTELEIEGVILAEEMEHVSLALYKQTMDLLPEVEIQKVPHEQFKSITRQDNSTAFIRTGEATSYANIILISGVNFG